MLSGYKPYTSETAQNPHETDMQLCSKTHQGEKIVKILISHNEGDGNPNFVNANVPHENSFDLASEGNKLDYYWALKHKFYRK